VARVDAPEGKRIGGYAFILKEATGIVNRCADAFRHLAERHGATIRKEGAKEGKP